MTYPRLRLTVALALFLGWIGFLVYLVVKTRDPVILARPQFLDAEAVIVAEVRDKHGVPVPEVKVKETLWSADAKPLTEATLRIDGLTDIRAEQGWRGPRDYILPLRKDAAGYHMTALLWSPGYTPLFQLELVDAGRKPDQVADKVQRPVEEVKRASIKMPLVLRRNLPYKEAIDLKEHLESLGAQLRSLRPGEYRIYPATPDARAQVTQIKGGS